MINCLNVIWVRTLLPSVAGFFFYGLWAYCINLSADEDIAVRTALVQGSYSFVLTLSFSFIIEWLYTVFKSLPYRIWLVGLTTCVLMYLSSWCIHTLNGTPHIVLTMLPGVIIGTGYSAYYLVLLRMVTVSSKQKSSQ